MHDRIVIEGLDGTFGAYIARPAVLAAPAVVVLQELFGVNADIRATCDELAAQGFIAIAPDGGRIEVRWPLGRYTCSTWILVESAQSFRAKPTRRCPVGRLDSTR